jgi:hypothetical protein
LPAKKVMPVSESLTVWGVVGGAVGGGVVGEAVGGGAGSVVTGGMVGATGADA